MFGSLMCRIFAVLFCVCSAVTADVVPTKKEATASIEKLISDPTAKDAMDHVPTILRFAEGSPDVMVELNITFIPWMAQEEEVKNSEILLGAYVGGNLLPQIEKGVNRDHTREGVIAMLKTYKALRKNALVVEMHDLDHWSAMNDAELDKFIKEVEARAQPLEPMEEDMGNVELVHLSLYQPDEELEKRGFGNEEFALYMTQLVEVVEGEFVDVNEAETLDLVVIVRPKKRAKFWYMSSLDVPPNRVALSNKLEGIVPVEVKNGPIAFSISFNIANAKRAAVKEGEFEPPIPKEWEQAMEQVGDEGIIPDDLVDVLWAE